MIMDDKLAETIEILRRLSEENQRIFIAELHRLAQSDLDSKTNVCADKHDESKQT